MNETSEGSNRETQYKALLEIAQDLTDAQVESLIGTAHSMRTTGIGNLQSGISESLPTDTQGIELVWKCTVCGHLLPRVEQLPDNCPSCESPKTDFVAHEED